MAFIKAKEEFDEFQTPDKSFLEMYEVKHTLVLLQQRKK